MSNPNYRDSGEYIPQHQEPTGYGAPRQSQGGYTSYEPPRDDGPRHDLAVAQYEGERDRHSDRRPGSRGDRSRDQSRYDDRLTQYDDYDDYDRPRGSSRKRSSSRPRSRGFGENKEKNVNLAKEVGATAVGGAVGAFAGRKLGHKSGLATAIGTLAGAWAGHELEGRYEKKRSEKKEHDDGRLVQRSSSRSRDYDSDEDDDYDRRPYRQNQRDQSRYD